MNPDPADRGPTTYRFLRGRAEWLSVAALVALAFALRVVYVLGLRASAGFADPTMDAGYHVAWAQAFARGEDFQPGPFFRAPLYPWFLGTLFRLFGDGLLVPRLVQALLGAVATLLVYLLGRALFDRRVAWWAALGAATYWVAIYFDGELLIPTLAVPLNLAALLLSVHAARRARPASWGSAAGIAWGLSAIARPNVLLFMPFLALWLWRRAGLRAVVALTLGTLLPILPVTTYNAVVGGDRVLISSQAGVNLWIGNHPGADGSTAVAPGTRADWWGGYDDTIAQAEAAEGRALAPSEVSRHYARRAADFVLGEPARSIPLLLFKLRLFWTDWELGNNQDVRFSAFRFNPWLRWTPLRFGVVAAAGLVGLVLGWPRRRELFPLWGFLLVYSLSVVAFFVNGRYRLPVVPVLLLFAAHAGVWLVDELRQRRFARAGAAALAIVAGTLATRLYPPGLATDDATGLWQLGIAEEARGEREAAERYLREALEVRPTHAYARVALGRLLADEGRTAEAIVELEAAAALPTTSAAGRLDALQPLLDAYVAAGRLDDARSLASRELERHPDVAGLHYALGRVHVERADWPAAYATLRRAEELDRGHPLYGFGVASAAQALGRLDECRAALERSVAALVAAPRRVPAPVGERIFAARRQLLEQERDAAGLRELDAARQAWQRAVSGSRTGP